MTFTEIRDYAAAIQSPTEKNGDARAGRMLDLLLLVAMAAKRLSENVAEFDTITDSRLLELLDDAFIILEAAP